MSTQTMIKDRSTSKAYTVSYRNIIIYQSVNIWEKWNNIITILKTGLETKTCNITGLSLRKRPSCHICEKLLRNFLGVVEGWFFEDPFNQVSKPMLISSFISDYKQKQYLFRLLITLSPFQDHCLTFTTDKIFTSCNKVTPLSYDFIISYSLKILFGSSSIHHTIITTESKMNIYISLTSRHKLLFV